MSEQDMKNHIANRNYLLKLHDKKTEIDESYKPIAWFEIKHECEDPGLMNGISPKEISSRSWPVTSAKWCILNARNKCVSQYNKTKKMPYFSIFKNNEGKIQWALFDITDEEFNTKSVKRSDFSTIELEQDGLEMNIDFKGGDITFNDKNNILIPSNYTINSGKGDCKKTVAKKISDCDRILQEKKNKCNVAKNVAITANEQIVQYQLLGEVDDLIDRKDGMSNIEGYDTLVSTSKNLNSKIKDYSEYGEYYRKKRMRAAKMNKNRVLGKIDDIINREKKYNYASSEWKRMRRKRDDTMQKYTGKLNSYRGNLLEKKNDYNNRTRRHYKNAYTAGRSKSKAIKKKNCSKRKSMMKYYKQKKNWRTKYFSTPRRVRCGFVGSGNNELVGYEPNGNFTDFNADDNDEGFGSIVEGLRSKRYKKWKKKMKNKAKIMKNSAKIMKNSAKSEVRRSKKAINKYKNIVKSAVRRSRKAINKYKKKVKSAVRRSKKANNKYKKKKRSTLKRNGPRVFLRQKTQSKKRLHNFYAHKYNNLAKYHAGIVSRERDNANRDKKNANKYAAQLSRSYHEGFKSNIEGYGVKNTCNNSDVDANFEISHDNSIHNCNSESVFLKYTSADYKKTVDVIEDHTFTLPSSILSNITPALFNSSAGECNNNTNIKNQRLELSYSIKHDKEAIKIEELMIDSQGNGILKYTANNMDPYNYILGDKSNNINERRIIMDGNGNVKMNKDVIFTNRVKTDASYIVGGYTSNNNLSNLKSGQEISSSKYRLTLGSTWNNSTVFYNTKNTGGNTGVTDLHGNSFKYTEHYHKTKSSTVENVFILYKIKTYGLPKLLYEHRIYANIEKVIIDECDTNKGSKNLCYIRAIKQKLVGDEMLDENNNVNIKNIQSITMDEFKTNVNYNTKYINNNVLSSVPENINEIRIFLIKSLNNIHMKIASVMKSGVGEGFKGYDNEFRGYSTIEGFSFEDNVPVAGPGDYASAVRDFGLLDDMKAQNDRINEKTVKMNSNADSIRTKLHKLTGYGGTIHTATDIDTGNYGDYTATTKDNADAALKIHDEYDDNNTLIPFIFDKSGTDYYKDRETNGKIDPRAKIDAIDEDLKEMLYQQNTLYTIGSITSATFIITAILLARNSSS